MYANQGKLVPPNVLWFCIFLLKSVFQPSSINLSRRPGVFKWPGPEERLR